MSMLNYTEIVENAALCTGQKKVRYRAGAVSFPVVVVGQVVLEISKLSNQDQIL